MQLTSNRRPDAVGADQDVSCDAPSVVERGLHTSLDPAETRDGVSELNGIGGDRMEQTAVKDGAQDAYRRFTQPRADVSHVECAERRAVLATDLPAARYESTLEGHLGEAQPAEGRHGVRREQQREAELTRTVRTLVHASVPPGLPEREGCGETADACTNDESSPHGRSSVPRCALFGAWSSQLWATQTRALPTASNAKEHPSQLERAAISEGQADGHSEARHETTRGAELFRIYLRPAYIGTGVGSALLAREHSLRTRSVPSYYCFVHKDNELGKCFYLRQGFRHLPGSDRDDEWYMEKTIS